MGRKPGRSTFAIERDERIVHMLSEGLLQVEIAGKLFIAEGTLSHLISQMMKRRGVKTTEQLVAQHVTEKFEVILLHQKMSA